MDYTIEIAEIKRFQLNYSKVFIAIGLFFLLYNPPIFSFNSMHLIGLVSIIYLLTQIDKVVKLLRSFRLVAALLGVILWFGYLLVSVVFLNSEDFDYIITLLYFLLDIIPFGMATRIIFEKNRWYADDFISVVVFVATLQSLLSLAAFFSPEIQSFFVSKFLDYGYGEVIVGMSRHRFYGFAAGLTFDMPILQTIIALLVIHPSRKLKIFDCFIAFLLFFSAIINARNAMIVACIGFFSLISLDRIPLKRKLRYCVLFAIVALLIAIILLPVIAALAPSTYEWIAKGFEEILTFIFRGNEGATQDSYFTYILNPQCYRFPTGICEVLFGVGHPTMGMGEKYGYGSDIGFINDLWLGGIFYMVFLYSFFAKIMFLMRKHIDPRVSFIGTFMLIMYPFVNIKGVAAGANMFSYFLLLFYIIMIDRENNKLCSLVEGMGEEGMGKIEVAKK